ASRTRCAPPSRWPRRGSHARPGRPWRSALLAAPRRADRGVFGLSCRAGPHPKGGAPMKRSTNRILTTHTGSLPRADDLTATLEAMDAGDAVDATAFEPRVRRAVADVVRRQ